MQLFDYEGNLIDEVEYVKSWGDANGTGRTLALTDPFDDNGNYKLWSDSDMHGTPGAQNGTFKPSHDDFSANVSYYVDIDEELELEIFAMCYPNPFDNSAAIVWEQLADAVVTLELFAANGTKIATVANDLFEAGRHQTDISAVAANWTTGLYFAKINIVGQKPVIIKIMKQ